MLYTKFQGHMTFGSGHLGHVYKFLSPLPKEALLQKKSNLIGRAISGKKMFENNGHIHVYSPGTGADNSLRSIFFRNINLLSI